MTNENNSEKEIEKEIENICEQESTDSNQACVEQEEATPEKDPLEVAQSEIADLKNQLLYKIAEFDNYRKRTDKRVSLERVHVIDSQWWRQGADCYSACDG